MDEDLFARSYKVEAVRTKLTSAVARYEGGVDDENSPTILGPDRGQSVFKPLSNSRRLPRLIGLTVLVVGGIQLVLGQTQGRSPITSLLSSFLLTFPPSGSLFVYLLGSRIGVLDSKLSFLSFEDGGRVRRIIVRGAFFTLERGFRGGGPRGRETGRRSFCGRRQRRYHRRGFRGVRVFDLKYICKGASRVVEKHLSL